MAKIKGLKAKTEKGPQYEVPRRIYDIQSKASKKDPAQIAESMLKKIAKDIQIDPDLSQLKFDKVKETLLGSHVLFQQYHAGTPISGAWIRVDIDKDGKVYNILNDLVPEPTMAKTKKVSLTAAAAGAPKQLSAEEAKKRALEAADPPPKSSAEVVDNELVYYPLNGVPTLS